MAGRNEAWEGKRKETRGHEREGLCGSGGALRRVESRVGTLVDVSEEVAIYEVVIPHFRKK